MLLLSFSDELITVFDLLAGSSFGFRLFDWFIAFYDGFHENQRLDNKIKLNLSFSLTDFTHLYVMKAINHTFYRDVLRVIEKFTNLSSILR